MFDTSFISILASVIFVLGYILIVFEHKLNTHKSAVALLIGGLLWIIVALVGHGSGQLSHALEEAGAEIFDLFAFLLAAMALVEVLIHYRFFDLIRYQLGKRKLRDKGQFIVIGFLTFFLSAVLDNLTITIVMTQIARQFFKGWNKLVAIAGVVILANAGGAWSPIGDVTTIMIWLADKFSTTEIITQGFIPSASLGLVSGALLLRQIKDTNQDNEEHARIYLTRGEKLIIVTTLLSFTLPFVMNLLGLQPYIGLLLGLGTVWLLVEFVKKRSFKETHLRADIEEILKKTDISSLQFFAGILLAVSALKELGVLDSLSHILLGNAQDFTRVIGANIVLGLLSAVVDNVPLTALAIDVLHVSDPHIWVFLALMVGTGGSFLVIGSVAGIIAMGIEKKLTFGTYAKIASVPALVGYITAIVVWLIQYNLIT